MSKSYSAKVLSEVLGLFSMYMEKNSKKMIEDALREGEKPSPPPKVPKTRFEDTPDGRVFYANEASGSGVTVFVGTDEIFYPDVTKFFRLLDDDPTNELIVGEGMNHVYPLLPIREAKPAVERILQIVKR